MSGADYAPAIVSSVGKLLFLRALCDGYHISYRAFSLTLSASMHKYWNRGKRLHKTRVRLPQD